MFVVTESLVRVSLRNNFDQTGNNIKLKCLLKTTVVFLFVGVFELYTSNFTTCTCLQFKYKL